VATLAVSLVAASGLIATTASGAQQPNRRVTISPKAIYPVGVRNAAEPSGMSPPTAAALPGYARTYVNDFTGRRLPPGWGTFDGIPQGDNQSRWLPSHVVVGGGIVRLIASRDPRLCGEWVTGGVSQFGQAREYGAWFVRSRITGPGPDQNEMLWPKAPVWPPEVDFNETGNATTSTSWTVHFGHGNAFVQGTHAFNMTSWHTWGVIWTSHSLTFTVDGRSWGTITNLGVVPHQKMTLDLQQQVWCVPRLACPSRASALEVDWVAEYARS
jgi:hypothetical protein